MKIRTRQTKIKIYFKKYKCNHVLNRITVTLVEFQHNALLEEREHLRLLIKLITRHIVTVFVGKLLLQSTIRL